MLNTLITGIEIMKLKNLPSAPTATKMNTLLNTRFGFGLNYNKLTYSKAQTLNNLVTENIKHIKQKFGIHKTERNPKYMELLMVRESLSRWMMENQHLAEGEIGKSEAILAAKDMVDSIQDMVERVSKMQVEQLPALIDTIRDTIGMSQADSFKQSMGELLSNIALALVEARETADTSFRVLAGEPEAHMPDRGFNKHIHTKTHNNEPGDLKQDQDDDFGATNAAVGGTNPVGRLKR